MRIGIWCDYGFTLAPSEGIGVFVSNLVRGLTHCSEVESCLLVANAKDSDVLSGLEREFPQVVQVVCNPRSAWWRRRVLKSIRRSRRKKKSRLTVNATTPQKRDWLGTLESWLDRSDRPFLSHADVWLIPYVGLDVSIDMPHVVVVHDLVTYHFPDNSNPQRLEQFKLLVSEVVGRATLVACMSEFIRKNDLLMTLQLPESRTRMVRYAVPSDMGDRATAVGSKDSRVGDQKIIFYPSAFRAYKNHEFLIRSLAELSRRGFDDWQVVFTGIRNCPSELLRISESLGVADRVHSLGRISRDELRAMYQRAYVTAVPSLYEQGSFPLYESLHFGCPVMASDILSLREQFALMESVVPFFDPYDPVDFVDKLCKLERDRSKILAAQLSGFEAISHYTWSDAAKSWVAVFREAIQLHRFS